MKYSKEYPEVVGDSNKLSFIKFYLNEFNIFDPLKVKLSAANYLTHEPKALVKAGKIDVNSEDVKNSQVYKALHNAQYLQLGGFNYEGPFIIFTPEELLLVTEIAALSPTLIGVSYKKCCLSDNASLITGIISKSSTIEFVDMSYNDLFANATPAAKTLTEGYHSKMVIDFSSCYAGTVDLIKVFANVKFPLTVALGANQGWQAEEILKDYNEKVLKTNMLPAGYDVNQQYSSTVLYSPVQIELQITGGNSYLPIDYTFQCTDGLI